MERVTDDMDVEKKKKEKKMDVVSYWNEEREGKGEMENKKVSQPMRSQ